MPPPSGGPSVTYESLVDDYLSEAHRNCPGMGCPVAALAGDLARSDKHTRAVATRKTRDNIELLASLICGNERQGKRKIAAKIVGWNHYSIKLRAVVGTISMARAVSDEELSREILKTVAQRLKNLGSWCHTAHRRPGALLLPAFVGEVRPTSSDGGPVTRPFGQRLHDGGCLVLRVLCRRVGASVPYL